MTTADMIAHITLSPQDERIARLMGVGHNYAEIRKVLGLRHPSDVGNRVRAVCAKFEINRHQLALFGAYLNSKEAPCSST